MKEKEVEYDVVYDEEGNMEVEILSDVKLSKKEWDHIFLLSELKYPFARKNHPKGKFKIESSILFIDERKKSSKKKGKKK